ncbi:MAG: hypothetical protein ACQEUN_04780 [Pseudomonadota bacterium]
MTLTFDNTARVICAAPIGICVTDGRLSLTLSAGIAHRLGNEAADALIEPADPALSRAKHERAQPRTGGAW